MTTLLLTLSSIAIAAAQPPSHLAAGPAQVIAYRVVVYYRRDRPLDTFQYQIYDLRKGEYNKAVEDWEALMKSRFPDYEVRVRPVDLAREKGETEKLKVGAVIQRELLAAAALQGVFVGGPPMIVPAASSPAPRRLSPSPALPGLSPPDGRFTPLNLGPPAYSFPVPVPYPRPFP
ncbi:hypothetical protein [Aquisphaera insulae]|uniref:hypothetical protein n=1 Tax=Aquisphaera insulae TaxID=2712864 RepID=UPI0013EB3B2B|nr:hypothetical protein [Aquisphaera insulae]